MGPGFALFLRGAPSAPAVGQNLLAQTETIFPPVWAWLAFLETPAASTLIGRAVIFAVVVAIALSRAAASALNVSNWRCSRRFMPNAIPFPGRSRERMNVSGDVGRFVGRQSAPNVDHCKGNVRAWAASFRGPTTAAGRLR
jgi:hypothetical protein